MAIKKDSAGVEDLNFGMGVRRQIRRGEEVDITDINGWHIPFDDTTSVTEKIKKLDQSVHLIDDSATKAAAQAKAAAAKAEQAEITAKQAHDEFLGVWLGVHPTDPVQDALGNPINVGDLYFNSVESKLLDIHS